MAALPIMSCQSPTGSDPSHKGQPADAASIEAVQRPIEEFIAAQGTFCIDDGMGGCFLFVPPVENFFGWGDPAKGVGAAFDYAGLADEAITSLSGGAISLGTTTSGGVTERPLEDGRAEIHVVLQTRNAMTFGIGALNDFNTDPLTFGFRAADILAGAPPALGSGTFHLKFINTAPGAPLPDLLQLAFAPEPGQEFTELSIYFRAEGTLHSASGFPEGAPGRLTCTQTGLFFTGFHGAVGDGFPAENIDVRPIRGGRGEM
jgi:hypothetical protein